MSFPVLGTALSIEMSGVSRLLGYPLSLSQTIALVPLPALVAEDAACTWQPGQWVEGGGREGSKWYHLAFLPKPLWM